ncbi:hypothetical protein P5G51_012210 [Virgibacillus sp. 179-BFC.A HS]|uniref:Uncharacterized protein n=1 Tax=Tigheibacillus jepli TaxID=3035914 RepID=A0ABU5CIC3_9BACI|nr:hypothetical protein [Virgibacillus sp. 179-BFC.A HS]MDY0406051.1 hypothetical protein [Virgibacillus sp. 179-BFC.A HS]
MQILLALIAFVMFFYTGGFAISMWKNKNKIGSIPIFMMAIAIAVLPFFITLR